MSAVNRRRFLGASAAAVAATVLAPGETLALPPAPADAGLLIRGPDGALYVIGDDELASFRIAEADAARVRPLLAGATGARHMPPSALRGATAVCSSYSRGLTFVDLATLRRGG